MHDILESDWKIYSREVFPAARDRIYVRVMDEAKRLLASSDPPVDQYNSLYKHLQDSGREIDRMFMYRRRSSAKFQLAMMIQEGLVLESETERFSEDMKEYLARYQAFRSED